MIGFFGKMIDSIGNVLFIDWAAYAEGNEGDPFPFWHRRFFEIFRHAFLCSAGGTFFDADLRRFFRQDLVYSPESIGYFRLRSRAKPPRASRDRVAGSGMIAPDISMNNGGRSEPKFQVAPLFEENA